jgi:hypothetical protein
MCANSARTVSLKPGRICDATWSAPNSKPVFSRLPTAGDMLFKTTMLLLNRAQRILLVEKLADIGNVAAGALIFGQFLSEYPFSPSLAAFGVGTWLVLTSIAVTIARRIDS